MIEKAMFFGKFIFATKDMIRVSRWAVNNFGHVVFGLGSCNEAGTIKNPTLAVFREKMLGKSMLYEGVSPDRFSFAHFYDYELFEEWWNNIERYAKKKWYNSVYLWY